MGEMRAEMLGSGERVGAVGEDGGHLRWEDLDDRLPARARETAGPQGVGRGRGSAGAEEGARGAAARKGDCSARGLRCLEGTWLARAYLDWYRGQCGSCWPECT
eukprot:1962199-Rhodomonas_salina.2